MSRQNGVRTVGATPSCAATPWNNSGWLPAQAVDTVVTSPPYYRQRDYTCDVQLGHEATPAAYVQRLVGYPGRMPPCAAATPARCGSSSATSTDDGQQLGMPWRVALALVDDRLDPPQRHHLAQAQRHAVGRQDATDDRPRVRVLPDQVQAVLLRRGCHPRTARDVHRAEPDARGAAAFLPARRHAREQGKNGGTSNLHAGRWDQAFHPKGRNKRTVWSIPLSKFREAHFAVYPETAGGELPAGWLPTPRRRARSVPGQWHDRRRRATVGTRFRRDRLRAGLLPHGRQNACSAAARH